MSAPGDGGDRDEAESQGEDVGIGLCGEEDWPRRVFVIIVGCPFETNAVERAADIVLYRNDIEKLVERDPFGNILCGDE